MATRPGDGRESEARQAAMTVGQGDCHETMQAARDGRDFSLWCCTVAVRGVEMAVTSLEIREDQGMAGWYEKEWPRYRQ